jgi:hypothetical protein
MSAMDIYDAIRLMADDSGTTLQRLPVASGRSRSYLHALANHGGVPKVSTLQEFASLCGYELHLVGHGRDIKIDAPAEAGAPQVAVEYLHDPHAD